GAAGAADEDASGFQRFFSRGAWAPDGMGRVVLEMVLKLVAAEIPTSSRPSPPLGGRPSWTTGSLTQSDADE
ncbi:MAG: hypothetical protein PVI30_15705, partial [Myxococcales bacterium]